MGNFKEKDDNGNDNGVAMIGLPLETIKRILTV